MNGVVIREINPDQDFPALAALLNTTWVNPVTVASLRRWEFQKPPGRIRHQWVAADSEGQLLGRALVQREEMEADRHFFVDVVVHPAHRLQGVGSALYDHILSFVLAQGATTLKADVRDNSPYSLHFARKRGFSINRHLFESVLDLRTFDATRFDVLIQSVVGQGIRLFSLLDAGETELMKRQLYELNRASALDDPSSPGHFFSYAEYENRVFDAEWFRSDGQIFAADCERLIGVCAVDYYAQQHLAYNHITGVLPPYRGRKIAQALKLQAIVVAQDWGATHMRTHNDSANKPILAINQKLGYRRRDGDYHMVNHLE